VQRLEQVVELAKRFRGDDDPETLGAIENLGLAYSAQRHPEKAAPLLQAVFDAYKRLRGPEHGDTLDAMSNLALNLMRLEKLEEAEAMMLENVEIRKRVNGLESRDTARALANLGRACEDLRKFEDADAIHRHALDIMRRVYGDKHPVTLTSMLRLADVCVARDRLEEAATLLRECLDGRRQVLPAEHFEIPETETKLRFVYDKLGRSTDSDALKQEIAAACIAQTTELPSPQPTPKPIPASVTPLLPAASIIVPPDSEWRWFHPTDGSDPEKTMSGFHKSFPLPSFDDSKWNLGKDSGAPDSGFGYGLSFKGVSIGKPEEVKARHTAYFRHEFTTKRKHLRVELRCQWDDGIIVYLDGKEIARDNMEPGSDAYLLPAVKAMDRENDGVIHRYPIPGDLPAGPHILAISVHNTAQPSSDLRLGGVSLVEVKAAAK